MGATPARRPQGRREPLNGDFSYGNTETSEDWGGILGRMEGTSPQQVWGARQGALEPPSSLGYSCIRDEEPEEGLMGGPGGVPCGWEAELQPPPSWAP